MDLYRSTLSMTQRWTAPIVSALMTNKGYLGPILIKQLQVNKSKIFVNLRLELKNDYAVVSRWVSYIPNLPTLAQVIHGPVFKYFYPRDNTKILAQHLME